MKQCKYCRSVINDEAIVCPHCKRKQKGKGKVVCIVLICIVLICLTVCVIIGTLSNLKQRKKENEARKSTTHVSQPKDETIKIGDKLISDDIEITIKNIEFSYDVLPDDTSGFYTHYPADKGNVYIHIDTDVKNTAKQNLPCTKIMRVKADYNNGYVYKSKAIPEDSVTGFTYAMITSIKPLETLGVRFLIECPEEVAESNKSLDLSFLIDDTKDVYTYKMR